MTHACNTAGVSIPTTPTRWDSSWPAFVTEPWRSTALGYFETRFGIPLSTFDAFHLLERRKAYVILNRAAPIVAFASLKVQNVGLPVLRKMPHHLKPTTAALQRFGALSQQHVVALSPPQTVALLRHGELSFQSDLAPGYVVLQCEENILGCGLYTPGRLRSQIPLRQVQHQRLPELE